MIEEVEVEETALFTDAADAVDEANRRGNLSRDEIEALLVEDEWSSLDYYTPCPQCGVWVGDDDTNTVKTGEYDEEEWCDDCASRCSECYLCETYLYGDGRVDVNDDDACWSCRGNNATWCDECSEYRWNDDESHDCGSGCGCESKHLTFTIPVIGEDGGSSIPAVLRNDTPMRVVSSEEIVTEQGKSLIASKINDHYMPFYREYERAYGEWSKLYYSTEYESIARPRWAYIGDRLDYRAPKIDQKKVETLAAAEKARSEAHAKWQPLQLERDKITNAVWDGTAGDEWQTERGTYPKRLRAALYKNHGIKIDETLLASIGEVARTHSAKMDLDVEITRDLNQSAADFGHSGSCWWTGYAHSRCTLKTNHGFGLRSFTERNTVLSGKRRTVSGRTWVIPLSWDGSRFTPTESAEPGAYVVFNGYGELSEKVGARALARMTGWQMAPVSIPGWPMYVNGNSGYLVAPKSLIEATENSTSRRLPEDLSKH